MLSPESRASYSSKVLSHRDSHPPNDIERELFGLPISLGGLGVCDPYSTSGENYKFSCELPCCLVNLILHQCDSLPQQCDSLPHDVIDSQCFIFKQLCQAKHQSQVDAAESVLAHSLVGVRQALECCKEKGASSWLSAVPIEQYQFALHKTDFTDALCLRYAYGWSPSHCVCGKAFSVSHAFSCLHGAFPILRHNDVRDLTAKLMSESHAFSCLYGAFPILHHNLTTKLTSEVCHDVQVEPKVEPHLQPLSSESLHYKSAGSARR